MSLQWTVAGLTKGADVSLRSCQVYGRFFFFLFLKDMTFRYCSSAAFILHSSSFINIFYDTANLLGSVKFSANTSSLCCLLNGFIFGILHVKEIKMNFSSSRWGKKNLFLWKRNVKKWGEAQDACTVLYFGPMSLLVAACQVCLPKKSNPEKHKEQVIWSKWKPGCNSISFIGREET